MLFATIFRTSSLPFIRALEVRHICAFVRASELRESGSTVGAALSVVFLHGCHFDLEGILSDAALLLRSRKRVDKSIITGDFNVDILPQNRNDPLRIFRAVVSIMLTDIISYVLSVEPNV